MSPKPQFTTFIASLYLALASSALAVDRGPNLLDNPGFEQGTNRWSAKGSALLVRTNASHTGGSAIVVAQRASAVDGISQSLLGKMQAGVKYFCSAWARVNSTNAEPLTLSIEFEDATGSHSLTLAQRTGSSAAWSYLSGNSTFSPTGPLQSIALSLSGPAAGVDFFADDLVVVPLSGLRSLPAGVWSGGIMGTTTLQNEKTFAAVTGREYDVAGTENALKFADTQPGSNTYSFAGADAIVDAAMVNGQNARGHTLVWHSAVPAWVTNGGYTSAQLQNILFSHIDTVVSRYKEKLFCWDAVNEALNSDGTVRSTIWYDQPGIGYAGQGTKYIEEVFKRARAADADVQLFYNDYSQETLNAKSDAMYAMAQDFLARDVPLDGIGFQMHVSLPGPNISSWRSNLQRFNDLGLKLHITEMDVRVLVDSNGVATASDLVTQGDVYFNVVGTALAFPNFKVIQTWGFTDLHSWIPGFFPGYGAALPLDRTYNRKPAWWALHDVLANQAEFLPVTDISAGNSHLLLTNTFFSAGQARQLLAGGPNAFFTLAVDVPYTGPYAVRVGVRKNTSSGQFQLAAQPPVGSPFTPVGSVQDTYAASTSYVDINLGTNTFAASGTYAFRFLVTDKNASSSGYNLVIDYLRLIPTGTDGNQAPSISGTVDVMMENTGVPLFVPCRVSDRETVESALSITIASSNTTLLPNANISIFGAGQNRVLSLTPAANQFGISRLTMIVTDANGTAATNQFNLTVNPPPILLGIAQTGTGIEVNWPSNAFPWRLESKPTLDAFALWAGVTNPPAFSNGFWFVPLPIKTNLFLRLKL